MPKKSIILSITCFLIITTTTSVIKNKSRNLEKEISKINKEIFTLDKLISDAEIDFAYLSNPEKLSEKLELSNNDKYQIFDSSRIFFSINHFLEQDLQETKFLNKNNLKQWKLKKKIQK